jgi:hypothetical protein
MTARPTFRIAIHVLAVILLVGALGGTCRSQELTRETVAQWVADLGSDSRAVRARAEAALVEHGTEAFDLLPNESTLDPAVRETLERIVRTVEDAETQKALIPREVRLRSKQLAECLDALELQTGNSIPRLDKPLPELTQVPPVEPRTFWQAIDWIESHSELRYGGHQLQISKQRSPANLQGPFRFLLLDHTVRETAAGQKLLSAKLRVECEPRLRPLFLVAGVDTWKARIGDQELEAFTPGASRELPAGRNGETDIGYDFIVPEQATGKLTLTGELSLTLSARTTSVTFSDLKARLPLVRRRGQASLSLLSIKPTEEETVIRLALAFPESRGLFESYRSSLLTPDLALEMREGTRIAASETAQIQEDPEGNILETRFPTRGATPTRLHALIPTAISTQRVRFEFRDLPQDSP